MYVCTCVVKWASECDKRWMLSDNRIVYDSLDSDEKNRCVFCFLWRVNQVLPIDFIFKAPTLLYWDTWRLIWYAKQSIHCTVWFKNSSMPQQKNVFFKHCKLHLREVSAAGSWNLFQYICILINIHNHMFAFVNLIKLSLRSVARSDSLGSVCIKCHLPQPCHKKALASD